MVHGRICVCCGEQRPDLDLKLTSSVSASLSSEYDGLFYCQPCVDDPSSNKSKSAPDMSVHIIPLETSVVELEATKAFEGLSEKEGLYAYYLAKADWEGSKICLLQCSPESPAIFSLLQLSFSSHQSISQMTHDAMNAKTQDDSNEKKLTLTQTEVDQALMYSAAFYANMGNYKSFGDTKFIPELSPSKFHHFLTASLSSEEIMKEINILWDSCVDRMYSLPPRHRQLGLGEVNGISTYFSANCNQQDASFAGKFMSSIGLSPYNTRLFKSESTPISYTIWLASSSHDSSDNDTNLKNEYTFENTKFHIKRGDYSPLMSRIVENLEKAIPFTANSTQTNMLNSYIQSFTTGSIDQHKQGSRYWIQDKGPAVESYIGFIESYRDPSGARGEWEGFVACVNRDVSRKFQILVDHAEEMLQLMPWASESIYEKDVFLRPDFTSLEVLAFGSSGVPAGINIPNYDDIRQDEGFKNVSLGNVLAASYGSGDKPVTFLLDSDQELFKALKGEAFEVQVGIHELLGHGSGKLYHSDKDDAKAIVASGKLHPLTKEPITGPFYQPGSTWDTTFGSLASTYEECRAEACGIYLCLEQTVLEVFGHSSSPHKQEGDIHDISYINWLLMVRAGLLGLEFYTPETNEWRQAHMRARYVILRVLLEAGEGLVTIQKIDCSNEDDKPDIKVTLDRSKIATVGKEAIRRFLLALQVYKSLGDYENGSKMYERYSVVTEEMTDLRSIVMARKEPRKLMVQPHLYIDDACDESKMNPKVGIKSFASTPAGVIESFLERFPGKDEELMSLYELDAPHVTD